MNEPSRSHDFLEHIQPFPNRTKDGRLTVGTRRLKKVLAGAAGLLLALLLLATPAQATGPVEGTASWYGNGEGVAMPFCTWTYRTTHGCGAVIITSLDTGMAVVSNVIDYCQCYVGTAQERVVDLQLGVVGALGLDPAKGLYRVRVEAFIGDLPDTSMSPRKIAPHWLR